jgi:ribosome maturation factor RimP
VGKRAANDTKNKTGAPRPRVAPVAEELVLARARPLAEALCSAEGLELVLMQYRRERGGRILRLFIDKPEGVTLEDCASVSRELGDLLDVHLPELGPYHLEVSSPGPNRPLARAEDFERFRGQRAKIRTRSSINGQKNFSGVLEGLSGRTVRINTGQSMIAIPIGTISNAYLMESQAPLRTPSNSTTDGEAPC